MAKMLWFRLQKGLSLFSMLLVEGFAETGLFRHLSNQLLWTPEFRKYIGCEGHVFFFKNTLNLMKTSEMERKIPEKVFCFWDNSILIGCVKLSLLK